MKLCKYCGIEKDEFEFHKDKRLKSGISNICKACYNKQNRKRIIENLKNDPVKRAKNNKYQRSWFKNKCDSDPEFRLKRNELKREWYKINKEKKGPKVKEPRDNLICKIIREHHELMKDDPQRMSTEFIQEIVGRKC